MTDSEKAERTAAADRIAICFYSLIETAITQGLTNADEVFSSRTQEGQNSLIVTKDDTMSIIKKVHAAIISSLKSKFVTDFQETVYKYMQSY